MSGKKASLGFENKNNYYFQWSFKWSNTIFVQSKQVELGIGASGTQFSTNRISMEIVIYQNAHNRWLIS